VQEVIEHCRVAGSTITSCWLLGPIGFYLAGCREWGVEPSDAIPLLEGASPSTVGPMHVLAQLRVAVENAHKVPQTLDDVRSISDEAAAHLDHYLEYRGSMMISRYDIDGVTLAEIPDVVLATILNGVERTVGDGLQYRIEVVRARVPIAHQEDFDGRLEEARAAMDLRDDNGPTTAEWPLGLLRLSMLEIGRRMVLAGCARRPADGLELHPDEISLAVLNGDGRALTISRAGDNIAITLHHSTPR
jgi:pyruvate,water dikinase